MPGLTWSMTWGWNWCFLRDLHLMYLVVWHGSARYRPRAGSRLIDPVPPRVYHHYHIPHTLVHSVPIHYSLPNLSSPSATKSYAGLYLVPLSSETLNFGFLNVSPIPPRLVYPSSYILQYSRGCNSSALRKVHTCSKCQSITGCILIKSGQL